MSDLDEEVVTRIIAAEKDIRNILLRFVTWIPSNGWVDVSDTWTYNAVDKFTIPTDGTLIYQPGDSLRWKQGGLFKYGTILSVTATLITIITNTDYTVANSAVTDVGYSRASKPYGFPASFNYLPVYSASTINGPPTVTTNSAIYIPLGGRTMWCQNHFTITALNGSTGQIQYTLPVTSSVYNVLVGREIAVVGSELQGIVNSAANKIVVFTYNNLSILLANAVGILDGVVYF